MLAQPIIRRNQEGMISIISPEKFGEVFYTTDDSNPSRASAKYNKAFYFDGKTTIKAIVYYGDEHGEVGARNFEISKANWQIERTEQPDLPLFDGNPNTSWVSANGIKEVVVDFMKSIQFSGLTYLPDQARWSRGIALNYQISVSDDGENWKLLTKGDFSNIRNNPITQTIYFGKKVKSRFIKFETTSIADGQNVLGIAELNIISY